MLVLRSRGVRSVPVARGWLMRGERAPHFALMYSLCTSPCRLPSTPLRSYSDPIPPLPPSPTEPRGFNADS